MTRPRPTMTRVVLHVGLPKTGTTYLQAVLAHHRDALREAGVLYPFVRPQAMFLGAVEVRGSREKFGLTAEDVAGTWQARPISEVGRHSEGAQHSEVELQSVPSPRQVGHWPSRVLNEKCPGFQRRRQAYADSANALRIWSNAPE